MSTGYRDTQRKSDREKEKAKGKKQRQAKPRGHVDTAGAKGKEANRTKKCLKEGQQRRSSTPSSKASSDARE